jgi:hypothetical protein
VSGLSQIADEIVAYLQPIADGLEFPDSLQNLLNHVGAVNGSDDALIGSSRGRSRRYLVDAVASA